MQASLTLYSNGQAEQKEQIDRTGAIILFGEINWQEEIEKSSSTVSDGEPRLVFRSDKLGELSIVCWSEYEFEIILRKNGKIGSEPLSLNLNRNPSGTKVEDFIAAYYDGDLDESMRMEKEADRADSKAETGISFSFDQKNKIRFYIFPVLLTLLAGFAIYKIIIELNKATGNPPWLFLIAVLPALSSWWFFFRYYRHDKGKTITINPGGQLITIEKNGKTVSFTRKDLEAVRFFSSTRSAYRYILFKLKNGKHYSVTVFTAEPLEILSRTGLNVEQIDEFFPVITAESEY